VSPIFGTGKLLVIAELAQSYEGSFDDAQALIRAAASAKADAVKFQIFSADELAVPDYEYYALYQKLEFSETQCGALFDLARTLNMKVFADVFGTQSLAMLDRLEIDCYKIHAADMRNLGLLKQVGATHRPVILSTGGSTSGEIAEAIDAIKSAGTFDLCLMHGFQASPTATVDTRFLRLNALKRTFKLPVGFADHIDGEHPLARYWPFVALGAGMDVLEKHLTLNRADKKEDYISALNPPEFRLMVDDLRMAEAGLGHADFDFSAAEAEYREGFRKRVVTMRPIAAGTVIDHADVTLKRGGTAGFWDLRDVIGRTTKGSVAVNVPLSEDALSPREKRLRLVATLACRAGGSRLYGKPVQRIGDRTILEYLVARIQSVKRVDQVVLAISEGSENELFKDYANKLGVDYVIGDEWDVQERLIIAGEKANADLLLRATTESPFLYTDNVEELVERHIAEGAALSVTEGLPDGAYCEIISLDAIKDAHARGERRHRSELCTLYMFEHPEKYKHFTLKAPAKLSRASDIRLTVDYPEDLIVCRKIAEELGRDGPLFSLEAIVDFLDAHPRLNAVNNWIAAGQSRIWA
jgi:N,N'-diacetyllegionaminate synthase